VFSPLLLAAFSSQCWQDMQPAAHEWNVPCIHRCILATKKPKSKACTYNARWAFCEDFGRKNYPNQQNIFQPTKYLFL
jgi:hypothetical protein